MRSSSRRPTLFAAGAVAAIVGMLVATTPVPHASAATKKTTVKKAVTTKASIKAASNKTASKVKAAPVTTKPDPDKAQFIPGRPWTALIPDPDTFDWNRTNRPGYRLRPMNTVQQNFRNYIKDDEGTNFNLNPFHPSTIDLSGFAKSIMFSELGAEGFLPFDWDVDAAGKRMVDFLNAPAYQPRNWFERAFGRAEPWVASAVAGSNIPLAPGAPAGNVFPGDKFNGMQITYNVGGATLGAATDSYNFTTSRTIKGFIGTGTLSVSGSVSVGGFGADLTVRSGIWSRPWRLPAQRRLALLHPQQRQRQRFAGGPLHRHDHGR